MSRPPIVETALRFSRIGPVFPLIGKVPPAGTRGFHGATRAPGMIRRQFQEHARATGYLIRTGQELPSGGSLAVVDVDPRHGGDTSLGEWEEAHSPLPATFTVRTGGGGLHLYFSTAEPLSCRTGFLPGVDLKAEGGYVVGPGSAHPAGGLYQVADRLPIAPLPMELLGTEAAPEQKVGPAPAVEDVIPAGFRDNALTSVAGTLRRRGLVAEEILPALIAVNERRCRPPLPLSALERIARSVARKPAARPLFSTTGAE